MKNREPIKIGRKTYIPEEGESYNASKGLWRYRYRDDQGQKEKCFRNYDDMRKFEAEIKSLKDKHLSASSIDATVNDMYELWVPTSEVIANTKRNYVWNYSHYIKESHIGKMRVIDVTAEVISDYYKQLMKDGNSFNTVSGINTVLGLVMGYAMKKKRLIYINPCQGMMKSLERYNPIREITVFTEAQQKAFLDACREYDKARSDHGCVWYPVFAFMLGCGCRVGELSGLQWDDIRNLDSDEAQCYINHNLVEYSNSEFVDDDFTGKLMTKVMSKPKTKAGIREFTLTSLAREALLEQRDLQKATTKEVAGYQNFVFVNRYGLPYKQGSINKALKKIIQYAEELYGIGMPPLEKFSSHNLRKSFITRCAEQRIDIKVCCKIVGHSDYKTTFTIYQAVCKDFENAEISRLKL